MKTVLLALSFFTSLSLFAQKKIDSPIFGPLDLVQLDYGLASVEEGISDPLENSPTKTHGWLKDFVIVKVTDSIQIKPKANFGVVYEVKAKDTVDIEYRYRMDFSQNDQK